MLDNIKNAFDFYLRNKFRFSRKNYVEQNEEKYVLDKELAEQEDFLLSKYNMWNYKTDSTISNYYQNLSILEMLDKYMDISFKENLKVLDVGSKNWFYVPAEYNFFKKYCDNLHIDGVELDAFRLYSNFYSRFEVAKYYSKDLQGANYIPDNIININKEYDYIVWILPFLTKYPLRCWGLPDKYFQPKELFEHVYSLLKSSGKMIIVNQGIEEFNIQKQIAGDKIKFSKELDISFYEYKNLRFVSVLEK